jgi:hypothetical protein
MLFLVVLVLVAVLLHVGAASEVVESAAELQQNAQRMIDERNEAVINIIADHLPELNREEVHKRRLFSHYTKYLGYYQFSTFLVDGKPSCAAGGAPLTASGIGYGCISLAPHTGSCTENLPCSFGNSCSESSDGVKIRGKLYMGKDCTGAVYSGPGAEQMEAAFDKLSAFPACENGVKYTCAAFGGLPASLYNGYRVTTYWDTKTCMGNPISYTNYYDSASESFTCEDGQIWSKKGDTTTKKMQNTCTDSPLSTDSSMSYGCVTAMPSLGTREFTMFDMEFNLVGGEPMAPKGTRRQLQTNNKQTTDGGSASSVPIINKITAVSSCLGVNYDSIRSMSHQQCATPTVDNCSKHNNEQACASNRGCIWDKPKPESDDHEDDGVGGECVTPTVDNCSKHNNEQACASNRGCIWVKPESDDHDHDDDGVGGECVTPTEDDCTAVKLRTEIPVEQNQSASEIHADIQKKAENSENCIRDSINNIIIGGSSHVTDVEYISSTSPTIIRQTPAGIVTDDPAPASKGAGGTSGASIAAAVVGGFVVVGGIGFYYYTQVYKPKLAKHAVEKFDVHSAPQVHEASNPVHASSGAATSAPPPPECPSQTI